MAEVLVSLVLEKLGSIILDGLDQEVRLVAGVKKEIKNLTDTLTIIKGVLEDAEAKQVQNEAIKLWMQEFKDISYDAEDILDEWCTISLIPHTQQPNMKVSIMKQVSEIYGRVNDKDILMSKLLSESSDSNLRVQVISIVGTGGFGKTTLAQLILKEEKMIASFEKRIWVCVSDPFLVENVAKEIIQQAQGDVPNLVGWQSLLEKLSTSVQGKRFILVLDDVWSCPGEEWRQLKNALNCGAVGSRILMTTRNENVAMMMDSRCNHLLGQLHEDDCWSLFKSIAFQGREDDLDRFKDIGEDISRKCKGVPLAVKVIASVMRSKRTRQEWRNVSASNIWEVQEGENGFLPSILFSYYALPPYLKPCLIYFAVFPKDAVIEKEDMVKLWLAQGYLGSDGSVDLESTGRDYFNNLAMLSFFQDFERDDEGNISSCKMHDLVHDFVQFLTKTETIILENEEVFNSIKVRHLCAVDLRWPSIYKQKNLRTLRTFPGVLWRVTADLELLPQLQCLRVLSLHGYQFKKLASEVERLMHLRYLDLSNNFELEELPETICNLINLQTLLLKGCESLVRLPEGIKMLSNLRHLEIGRSGLSYIPQGITRLSCLRTLDVFIVGVVEDQETKEKGCTIGELKLLNNLQGHLKITRLRQVTDISNAAEAELDKKEKLGSLEFQFDYRTKEDKGILEALQPHRNLEKLLIDQYAGIRLPDWISSLSNLTKLTLTDLTQCLQLPALGKLPSLEALELCKFFSVKSIGYEFYGLDEAFIRSAPEVVVIFPKLKKLRLDTMPVLEKWDLPFQSGVDFFPNLHQLEIDSMRRLQVLPTGLGKLKSLEKLELIKLDGLKHSFLEFLGISTTKMSDDRNGGVVVFPALRYLRLLMMTEWEKKIVVLTKEGEEQVGNNFMPCLSKLEISDCEKLKVIPFYFFSLALRDLEITYCPQLTGLQSSLHNKNLPSFEIFSSSQSSLPHGFYQLTSIRQLKFSYCEFLDFGPEDLKHLTMLEQLEIYECPILAERFRRGGEISSCSSSHSYKISISPDPINVHTGIGCDNCEMDPIVGKRYKCKDCYKEYIGGFDLCEQCYNTPSNYTDYVNQHHRKGHTFELIANRGDNPVPLHSDDSSKDAEGGLVPAKSTEIEEQNKA